MALPLFGGTQQKTTKNLIEFKAGKMVQKGKMVHPDTRKGTIYVYKSDDSLTHFCWKDRSTGEVVDDLIIFPDDADFSRVTQCTTGRVYIMKFRSSNRRFFCWMQEPKEDQDEERCKKVNEILNGSTPSTDEAKPAATPAATTTTTTPAAPVAGNLGNAQLMDMLSGATPLSSRSNGGPVSVAALQNILQNMPSNGSANGGAAKETVSPANVISKEAIDGLLECPDTVAKLEQHLPEALRGNPETLRSTLNSPQFQQGLQLFSSAFKSGQLAPLMKSLGFTDSAGNAAAGGDFEAFVRAVADATKEKEKDEVEEDMALD